MTDNSCRWCAHAPHPEACPRKDVRTATYAQGKQTMTVGPCRCAYRPTSPEPLDLGDMTIPPEPDLADGSTGGSDDRTTMKESRCL